MGRHFLNVRTFLDVLIYFSYLYVIKLNIRTSKRFTMQLYRSPQKMAFNTLKCFKMNEPGTLVGQRGGLRVKGLSLGSRYLIKDSSRGY